MEDKFIEIEPVRIVFVNPITGKAHLANVVEHNTNYYKVVYDDGIVGWYPLDYPHIYNVVEAE